MSNVITALITVAILLAGVGALAKSGLTSADLVAEGWLETEPRYGDRIRTELTVIDTLVSGSDVDITVRNTGTTALRAFPDWDVVIEYYKANGDLLQGWFPYDATPDNNEWTVEGIYRDASASLPEVYQPGILDPGEEAVIGISLAPAPKSGQTHKAVIGTFNGVSTSTTFVA